MKQIFIYSILFIFCLYLGSCKSSQRISKKNNPVSIEDFRPLNQNIVANSKAVNLSEIVDAHVEAWLSSPWEVNSSFGSEGWTITVEDKIRLLTDNINNESFCWIDYFNPLGVRWNLMTKCDMYLYDLAESGKVKSRKIKQNEIVKERLNDSVCRIRLNIHESVSGKILVRKYTIIRPYYSMKSTPVDCSIFEKIEPWTFQRDIPLLVGKYEIYLLEQDGNYKVVKLGNGEMDIKYKNESVRLMNFWTREQRNEKTMTWATTHSPLPSSKYKAIKVTATVSNVPPLPKDSGEQPLGIEILRNWEE